MAADSLQSRVRDRVELEFGPSTSVGDLAAHQQAAAVWGVVKKSDDHHVRVRRDSNGLWNYDGGVWRSEGERALAVAAREGLGPMVFKERVLAEMKTHARADPAAVLDADEWGVDPGTVAVGNGLLDLSAAAAGNHDEALRPLRPDDYALAQLPVEYDPDAEYDEWAAYVDEWAEDGRADALQEYVGYCLHMGGMPIARALLLVGSGSNGKSTFLHVVRSLLGSEHTASIGLQTLAEEEYARADLYGAVANIDDDLSERKLRRGLGMVKKLTAGDEVRGRHPYERGIEYEATAKHLYAANSVPDVSDVVADDDEAFWRRWLVVEFPNYYPPADRNPDLRDRLAQPDALSGVLNWAIEGWGRLLDRGYFSGEHRDPQAKRQRWQAWGDSVDKFVAECVERDPDAARLSTGDAYDIYTAWCREHGEDVAGQQQLTAALKRADVGYQRSIRVNGDPVRGYDALGIDFDPDRDRDGQQTGLSVPVQDS